MASSIQEGVLAAGFMGAGGYFFYQQPLVGKQNLMQAGLVGVIQVLSSYINNYIISAQIIPPALLPSDILFKPITTGLVYTIATAIKPDLDSRQMLYRFLMSGGSSYAAGITNPIVSAYLTKVN